MSYKISLILKLQKSDKCTSIIKRGIKRNKVLVSSKFTNVRVVNNDELFFVTILNTYVNNALTHNYKV